MGFPGRAGGKGGLRGLRGAERDWSAKGAEKADKAEGSEGAETLFMHLSSFLKTIPETPCCGLTVQGLEFRV